MGFFSTYTEEYGPADFWTCDGEWTVSEYPTEYPATGYTTESETIEASRYTTVTITAKSIGQSSVTVGRYKYNITVDPAHIRLMI